MPLLRLLSASLIASAFILQAAAQAPAAAPNSNPHSLAVIIANPRIFTTDSLPAASSVTFLKAAKPQSSKHSFKDAALLGRAQTETLLAQTHAPCYTLRVYGFTPRDLQSPHPQPSSETDCTPASSVKLKSIEVQAIKK